MKAIWIQIFSAFVVSMVSFFAGYTMSWTSYSLETLAGNHSPLGTPITRNEGYLLGSLLMPGSFLSTLSTGWLSDTLGRKRTQLLSGLCHVLAWSLITTGSSVSVLMIARFVQGMANGIGIVICIPFVSELSQPALKGALVSWLGCSYCLGSLLSYTTGWLCSYQVINYMNLTLCVIHVLLVCTLKETPTFLLSKGEYKEALKSLQFYRGVSTPTTEVVDELKYLGSLQASEKGVNRIDAEKLNMEDEKEKLHLESANQELEMSVWKILWTFKPAQRALVISLTIIVLVVFSGTVAVLAYAAPLFRSAAPDLSPHVCSIILAVAFAIGSVLAIIVSDLFGRRAVMLSSSALSASCLALLASMLHWSWAPQWAIPAAILAYCCCFQTGVGNVPFLQLSEIFAPKVQSVATTLVIATMCSANFIILVSFGRIVDTFGLDGTFLLFSGCSFICTAVTYFFMRETKGVPYEIVQAMFEKGYRYRRG